MTTIEKNIYSWADDLGIIQSAINKGKLQTAINMHSKGFDIKEIAELTGLSRKELEKVVSVKKK